MRKNQALLIFFGAFALSSFPGWAQTPDGDDGVIKRISQGSKQDARRHTPCPPLAMKRQDDPLSNVIAWRRISSDQEAVGCLYELATALGPDRMLEWLQRNGFNAMFIKQFAKGNKDILLSAGWPIRDSGLLYRPGFLWSLQIRLLAYSQVFSFWWRGQGDLIVDQSYTFE
jgi:hypothetical protein